MSQIMFLPFMIKTVMSYGIHDIQTIMRAQEIVEINLV